MDWILFFTICAQAVLGALVLSFVVFIVGGALRDSKTPRKNKNSEVQAPPFPKRNDG